MQINCEIRENGNIQTSCTCLKSDCWMDYLAFKADAEELILNI